HKGILHTPAVLATYERQVAHAAIDHGADVVFGHHAHILRGIEVYRGRCIYHGLGNFVTATRTLTVSGNDHAKRREWAVRRRERYGFEPDPQMPTYPFHPDSRNTIIARCVVDRRGVVSAGFVPCYIDQEARPLTLAQGPVAEAVASYVSSITTAAGLTTTFEWRDGYVEVLGVTSR